MKAYAIFARDVNGHDERIDVQGYGTAQWIWDEMKRAGFHMISARP